MDFLRDESSSSVRLVVRANAWASCLPWRPAALKRERADPTSSGAHDSCVVIQTLFEQIQSKASPTTLFFEFARFPCILPSPPPSLLAAVALRWPACRRAFCHVAAHVDVSGVHARKQSEERCMRSVRNAKTKSIQVSINGRPFIARLHSSPPHHCSCCFVCPFLCVVQRSLPRTEFFVHLGSSWLVHGRRDESADREQNWSDDECATPLFRTAEARNIWT